MRQFLLVLAGSLLLVSQASGQANIYPVNLQPGPCDKAAIDLPGNFKKVDDYTFNYWDNSFAPAMTKRTDAMLSLIKECFPGAKGFESDYYREMFKGSYAKEGPREYILTNNFLIIGGTCKLNASQQPDTKDFRPSTETDNWLYTYFNYPGTFFESTEKLMIQGQMHTIYKTHAYIGQWKGHALFGSPEFMNGEAWSTTGNVWLMITRDTGKAYLQINRRMYLQALLDTYDDNYQRDTAGQHLKSRIQQYLASQPIDSLKLPMLLYTHRDSDPVNDWFNPKTAKTPPSMMFAPQHTYWRTNQDEAAPQMIVLRFRYAMGQWKNVELKKRFEKNFPLEKLAAMIDK
ncbi:MAG: hypothetical protein QM726_08825 [Chitinophagaceae bacterium]